MAYGQPTVVGPPWAIRVSLAEGFGARIDAGREEGLDCESERADHMATRANEDEGGD